MFKKLKDKLAEEVKSSPQRIQQFAQAAQAAVTSASSSISDITNNDLFSIGDNDNQQSQTVKPQASPSKQHSTFQEVSLVQPGSSTPQHNTTNDPMSFTSQDLGETTRQRRLSNSSFASDVSFRLPSYESPSTYHLQSDMEVSASEAEERGFSSGMVSLDRVTKEHIYAAYRRTQERYTKYRTQYADLARHYKLLERENAKARSVLVETQDKALRRISELREQCALEQSAKAHLEKALRVEIEEKNIKIETLNTKIKLLQNNSESGNKTEETETLITLTVDGDNHANHETPATEIATLNNKIEKLEMLVNKYKDSLKTMKEKNAQITTDLQKATSELATKNKEIEQLDVLAKQLDEANQKIQKLNDFNEELQNTVNAYDFNQRRERSGLEIDLERAHEEILELQKKIEVFTKREEENAISLAENKFSIHKELESKESEIKSLKDSLSSAKTEIQSLGSVINYYKNSIGQLEEEKSKLNSEINALNSMKTEINSLALQLESYKQKSISLENSMAKANEEYKCLQLQMKQETAEKLAMIDRNTYLENRNSQLSDENAKKSQEINNLENELQMLKKEFSTTNEMTSEKLDSVSEIEVWKKKCHDLESEIEEEREELEKLQSEIEKLLYNNELVLERNAELNDIVGKLEAENKNMLIEKEKYSKVRDSCINLVKQIKEIKNVISKVSKDAESLKEINNNIMPEVHEKLGSLLKLEKISQQYSNVTSQLEEEQKNNDLKSNISNYKLSLSALENVAEEHSAMTKQMEAVHKENESLKLEISAYKHTIGEHKKVTEQHSTIINELNNLQRENDKLKCDLKDLEIENSDLSDKLQFLVSQHDLNSEEIKAAQKEKEDLIHKLEEFMGKYQQLQIKLEHDAENRQSLEQNLRLMGEKIVEIENENKALNTELDYLRHLKENYSVMDNKVKNAEEENILLTTEITKFKQLNADVTLMTEKLKDIKDENISLKTESDSLKKQQDVATSKLKQLTELEEVKRKLETALDVLKKDNDDLTTRLNDLRNENLQLVRKSEEIEEKVAYIQKLENSLKDLTQENITLKTQCEIIATNVKQLENELCDVRTSHAEIEKEKDKLSSDIEKLDKNRKNNEDFEKDTQTNTDQRESVQEHVEVHTLKDLNALVHGTQEIDNEYVAKYNALQEEYNSLKEENRRLQSDISGLQTYLTQISKENSVLNDKMRELIVSGESSSDRTTMDTKNEIHSEREKIDDLIRENTILIEENLELKDQLNSQNQYRPDEAPSKNASLTEYRSLKEKYESLRETNTLLENRLKETELMNKSVSSNMQQVQENNDKLRLSNDKLERRLDEALVSLRHLHSLQENTELEYLRNILYEYLTGTGTHSVTLAKVLAAVVKFDEDQTRQVLQKEKERQGFLRQLGII